LTEKEKSLKERAKAMYLTLYGVKYMEREFEKPKKLNPQKVDKKRILSQTDCGKYAV
jgi:hypothetical protein